MALNHEQLIKLPQFQGFTPDELDALFSIAKRVEASAGEHIIKTGDAADCFFIVAGGSLEVLADSGGGKLMPVAQVGSGQLVGEMPLIYNQKLRQADIVCASDCKLLRFDYADYEEIGKLHPTVAKKFRSNIGKIVASRVWAAQAATAKPGAGKPGAPAAPARPVTSKSANRDAMKRAQVFAGLTDEEYEKLEQIAQPFPVERTHTVCTAGDPATSFFLITRGQVEVQIEKSGRAFPLARLGPGQCVGEMALIYKTDKRSATVVAVDQTHLLMWEFEDFNRLIAHEQNIGRKLRNNLGRVAASRSWALPEADEAKKMQARGSSDD
ncbi:MAG: cyclic nucleotide-binding domain-containing protein [Candidatus Sericytochromatia bacterium]|nr:cyclic nucleotide-binding domain-containing protein [Candidatus Tanganyikabacteria bacterium]